MGLNTVRNIWDNVSTLNKMYNKDILKHTVYFNDSLNYAWADATEQQLSQILIHFHKHQSHWNHVHYCSLCYHVYYCICCHFS